MSSISLDKVYYATVEGGSVNPIAIRPEITADDHGMTFIGWEDTSRTICVRIETINPPLSQMQTLLCADRFEIVTDLGCHIKFQKLTKEIFDERILPMVPYGVDNSSDEAIQHHYLTTPF